MLDFLKGPLILFIMIFVFFKYFIFKHQQNYNFYVGSDTVIFHSNWTQSLSLINYQRLHQALKLPGINHVDISLAMSNIQASDVRRILPFPLPVYESLKLNLGNIPLKSKGVQYVVNLIPNGIKKLQLDFDSIKVEQPSAGEYLAHGLNKLTSLQELKISLILSSMKDQGISKFFELHKISKNLKSLSLILIGNDLTNASMAYLQNYLSSNNAQLQKLQINLYANSIGALGAQYLAKALKSQNQLKSLDIDLYFNNITQNGTKALCDQISEFKNLQSLGLNLDFNYIKNQGAKEVGTLLTKLTTLKKLDLGVASKNFGFLGFNRLVSGFKNQTGLKSLTFRCGVNRVGINGAQALNEVLKDLKQLEYLNIGFVQNYVGDQGIGQLTKTITDNLNKITHLILNLGFNDAKGYGGINVLRYLSKKSYKHLYLSLSHNQFRDHDVQLMLDDIQKIIKNNNKFQFDFMETAISNKMKAKIQEKFQTAQKNGKDVNLFVNSVIPDEEPKKQDPPPKKKKDSQL